MVLELSNETLDLLFNSALQISPEIIDALKNNKLSENVFLSLIEKAKEQKLSVVDISFLASFLKYNSDQNKNQPREETETKKQKKEEDNYEENVPLIVEQTTDREKGRNQEEKNIETKKAEKKEEVKILFSYTKESTKRTVQDFVHYFNSRYKALEPLLSGRQELTGLTSISRAKTKEKKEVVSIIGMVSEKSISKNNNIILSLEDTTGVISVMFNQNKPELFNMAKEIVEDEVIAVTGSLGNNILFANNLIFPDVPAKELKKAPEEVYAVFIGDTHFGSTFFLKTEFLRFIHWIRGELGDEKQKELSKKVHFLFVVGDIVDGAGIYPTQEEELDIKDIYEQYSEFVRYLKLVPSHINIIVCPGNHDAMRIAEPQPIFYKDLAEPVYNLPNVTVVSNPGMVNILSSDIFPGFDILLYHGFSFIYYADNVESIRTAGGQKRPDLIMKFLLQKRHLAPTHTSTLYIPDKKDPLVIDKIPDFFVTGHIHRSSVSSYKNISLLNCSSWLAQTAYQEKVGLIPQPSRAILANLQTREIKILKFGQDKEEKDGNQ
jgi:DNA polymerase II small subunit